MIQDEDVLEKEDLYILDRMKQFVTSDEVSHFAAAKQLSVLIERAVRFPPPKKRHTGIDSFYIAERWR